MNYIIICDESEVISNKQTDLLDYLYENYNDTNIIYHLSKNEYVISTELKTHLFNKILDNYHFDNIEVIPVSDFKIQSEIKNIQKNDNKILKIFSDEKNYNYIKDDIIGFDIDIIKFKYFLTDDMLIDIILNDNLMQFHKYFPKEFFDEFNIIKQDIMDNKKILGEQMSNENKTKINIQSLKKYINETIDKICEDNNILVSDTELVSLIENIINEKLYGKSYDKYHDLKNYIVKQLNKISKTRFILSTSNINKNENGDYIITLVCSGNHKVKIKWGNSFESQKYMFNTSTPLIAGDDDYSINVYKLMVALAEKKDELMMVLSEIESKIIDIFEIIGGDIDTEENEENEENEEYEENNNPKMEFKK